jgi:BirA family biotin operon repressor/biotin-[acetyl-CoA-carboxylase] ligase
MSTAALAVRWLPTVPSTQDAVHALAEQGAPEGTAVAALEQTAGRGSRRSDWVSAPGGLWLSVLLRPESAVAVELLSLRVGLGLVQMLEEAGAQHLMLKWPNDILASGRKAGGILCEARWTGERPAWVAVGVGLNIRNQLPTNLASSSTRLVEHGVSAPIEQLADLAAAVVVAAGSRSGPLSAGERETLAAHDWLYGRTLASPLEGRASGVLADGALRVQRPDGSTQLLRAGPVHAAPRVILAE